MYRTYVNYITLDRDEFINTLDTDVPVPEDCEHVLVCGDGVINNATTGEHLGRAEFNDDFTDWFELQWLNRDGDSSGQLDLDDDAMEEVPEP